MYDTATPKISASLSIDPQTLSFTDPQIPTLRVTLISHHLSPITVYADDLSPALMLTCGAFTIDDLSNGTEVKQRVRTHCRIPPPTKVVVQLREDLFHTLLPETPVTFTTPFSHHRFGLQAGHRYLLRPADVPRVPWKSVRWWEYGTKEEVLAPDAAGRRLDGRRVMWGKAPHEAIELDVDGDGYVYFECEEEPSERTEHAVEEVQHS